MLCPYAISSTPAIIRMHINQNTIQSLINNSIQIVQYNQIHRLRVEPRKGAGVMMGKSGKRQ